MPEYTIKTIGKEGFTCCYNLTELILPNGTIGIGYYAFRDCYNLESIILPDSMIKISRYAFSNCRNLSIYCKIAAQPESWSVNWNPDNRPVVWGYTEQ